MTAKDIATLAMTAKQAGIVSLMQLQIAGELLTRGEATLISLANTLNTSLEAATYACAQMETSGGVKLVSCREAVGFSIVRLTPNAQDILKGFLITGTVPPLRVKKLHRPLGLRYTR